MYRENADTVVSPYSQGEYSLGFRSSLVKLLFVAAMIYSTGCNPPAASPSAKTPPPAAAVPTVAIVHPKRKSLQRVVEQPGTVQPLEETQLFARVPGYVKKVNEDIGKKVHGPKYDSSGQEIEPGQILVELALPEVQEEAKQKLALIRQAEAEVEQSRKALASADAHIATMDAMVLESKANLDRWESESKRISELVKNMVIDVQAGEETKNQFKAASARVTSSEAAVLKAKADRDKAKSDIAYSLAKVEVARAEAGRVEAMLAYGKIRAPYDGIVTFKRVNTGDLVQATNGKGEWLFTVARLDPVRIVVNIPEADAALVLDKAKVSLNIPALHDPKVQGAITRTSWALAPGARTLRAEIELPNKDGHIRPGMYVYAHITNPFPESWTLPTSAVAKQADATICFLIEGNKASRTPLQLGRTEGGFVEVLKYRKTPTSWDDWTGKENIAARAAGLTDGQEIKVEAITK